MKRKGETITEFLTAATVFGVIMAGLFEFIANQTEILANIRDKDELMYQAKRFMAVSPDQVAQNITITDNKAGVKFIVEKEKTLTVTRLTNDNKDGSSLTFSLNP